MEDILKHAIAGVCGLLILCCLKRQHRYWRELQENRPSGSIRAGYQIAILLTMSTLAISLLTQSEWMWEIFISVLLLALVFCVKVTFSPSVVALTLATCLYRLYTFDEFPLVEIWMSFTSMLTWRLPEDIRAAYACVSFLWIVIATLGSSHPHEVSGESTLDSIGDGISSLHA